MNRFFKSLLVTLIIAGGLIYSCQDDSMVVVNNDALTSASPLTSLLTSMSLSQGDPGFVIDSSACFNIQLPVQVTANGQSVLVSGQSGYDAVAAIFNQGTLPYNYLDYNFPITIIYPDGTQQVIANDAQYYQAVHACNTAAAVISSGCIAINYPVTLFGYNSNFQIENTYTITGNDQLFGMLQGLIPSDYYSVDYPITITVAGDQQVTINSNDQFLQVINDAVTACNNITAPTCNNPAVLTDDLIVYMPFHNQFDLMGATVLVPSDTTFVAGRNGTPHCALSFNNSQPLQIVSNDTNALVEGNPLSISLWFKMQNTDAGNYEHLFRKGLPGTAGFNLSVYDNNTPLFAESSSEVWDTPWNQGGSAFWQDTTNWHHLVITLDPDNNANLYRDGVLQNSTVLISSIGNGALDYYIGLGFTGYLDDLRVYKKVLLPSEVQTLYQLEGDCYSCLEL